MAEETKLSKTAEKGDNHLTSSSESSEHLSRAQSRDPVKKVLDLVSEMTVLELNDLVKVLEEKFGVVAAPIMMGGAAAGGGEAAASASPEEEQDEVDVILADAGTNKIAVIKVVREINQALGLVEAKNLVESAPKPLLTAVKKEAAQEAKKKLETAGAKVELR